MKSKTSFCCRYRKCTSWEAVPAEGYSFFESITSYVRNFMPKKTPKIGMFGPGLETNTRAIVRKILEDKTGVFNVTGMFPGTVRGKFTVHKYFSITYTIYPNMNSKFIYL